MARKRKHSGAEDFMDLVAKLPWWAGVALAVVSFMVLRMLAVPPMAQYLIPPLFLVAAVVSFLRRNEGEAVDSGSPGADALNDMSWQDFEMLVGEAFQLRGYHVSEQGGANADGGVDLVLRKDGEKFLVQCKQWKAFKVGVEIVRELFGVMTAKGATGGFVVTSGTFTEGAEAFAHGRNITLVDGPKLFDMLRQAKSALEVAPTIGDSQSPSGKIPLCPKCDASMVRRTAQKGSKAGMQFWGCSRYPECRGTR